jgi:hypothetical protein
VGTTLEPRSLSEPSGHALDDRAREREAHPPGERSWRVSAAARRLGLLLGFGLLPTVVTVAVIFNLAHVSTFLIEFKGDLYRAGVDIIHGHDPYRASFIETQAAIKRAGGTPQTFFAVPVYPAPALLATLPLSLLPLKIAGLLFEVASVAAVVLALRLLGVRDWRCYGAAFISYPMVYGLAVGSVSELMLLAVTVAWRWRARVWIPAGAIAAAVSAKLFLWPLALWLLLTRRFRTLALTLGLAVGVTLTAWAAIGFAGIASYPRMLSDLSAVEENIGVSLVSGLESLGVAAGSAHLLALALTGALLALAWLVSRSPEGERRAFGLLVIAALAASPIVWAHYLVLLFVPIALMSPRFSILWLVPLATYIAVNPQVNVHPWQILPYLAVEILLVARLSVGVVLGGKSPAVVGPRRFRARHV